VFGLLGLGGRNKPFKERKTMPNSSLHRLSLTAKPIQPNPKEKRKERGLCYFRLFIINAIAAMTAMIATTATTTMYTSEEDSAFWFAEEVTAGASVTGDVGD